MSRKYEEVQELLPIIKAQLTEGKTQREIGKEYGLKEKYVVKRLLKREREKEQNVSAEISLYYALSIQQGIRFLSQ